MSPGLALYVRRISKARHGTPRELARRCAGAGLGWVALGAVWQDLDETGRPTTKRINDADTIATYAAALEAEGVGVYVWGYPWQGCEEQFVAGMVEADGGRGRVLLDPELGANPDRASRGAGKAKANSHATALVTQLATALPSDAVLGLSSFGAGWRLQWFPLLAFTRAMVDRFGGRCFVGGQTYTDDGFIDTSMAEFSTAIEKAGGVISAPNGDKPSGRGVALVPNFGTYTWESPSGQRGKRAKGARAKPKTAAELKAHLDEFIHEGSPVESLIGWAENFMTEPLWEELARFSATMKRGREGRGNEPKARGDTATPAS